MESARKKHLKNNFRKPKRQNWQDLVGHATTYGRTTKQSNKNTKNKANNNNKQSNKFKYKRDKQTFLAGFSWNRNPKNVLWQNNNTTQQPHKKTKTMPTTQTSFCLWSSYFCCCFGCWSSNASSRRVAFVFSWNRKTIQTCENCSSPSSECFGCTAAANAKTARALGTNTPCLHNNKRTNNNSKIVDPTTTHQKNKTNTNIKADLGVPRRSWKAERTVATTRNRGTEKEPLLPSLTPSRLPLRSSLSASAAAAAEAIWLCWSCRCSSARTCRSAFVRPARSSARFCFSCDSNASSSRTRSAAAVCAAGACVFASAAVGAARASALAAAKPSTKAAPADKPTSSGRTCCAPAQKQNLNTQRHLFEQTWQHRLST